jgi:hypothetical protein
MQIANETFKLHGNSFEIRVLRSFSLFIFPPIQTLHTFPLANLHQKTFQVSLKFTNATWD